MSFKHFSQAQGLTNENILNAIPELHFQLKEFC
jgi:hypothetical protein